MTKVFIFSFGQISEDILKTVSIYLKCRKFWDKSWKKFKPNQNLIFLQPVSIEWWGMGQQ